MKMYQPANNRVVPDERAGFTLIELIVVVAILVMVAAAMVGVSSYLQTQKRVVLTEQCVQLLSTAVAEFYDITGHYPIDNWDDSQDETSFSYSRILGANRDGTSKPDSDELLYLQLSLLPQTRKIIAKLPDQLLARPLDSSEVLITVRLNGQLNPTPYLRSIVDPWHTEDDPRSLEYKRDADGASPAGDPDGVFPKIWSYGPDGKSGSKAEKLDDITNED